MFGGVSAADPNNVSSGGVEGVAVDPANPAHILIGTINGGIWRTTNGNRPFNGVDDDGANGVDDPLEQPDLDATHRSVRVARYRRHCVRSARRHGQHAVRGHWIGQ